MNDMGTMPKYYKIHSDGCAVELEPIYEELIPVKHGRWKNRAHLNDHLWAECSNCGFRQENYKVVKLGRSSDDYVGVRWHYCPNCGAKMDGGADHEN